jgi:hypothetical protein
MIVNKYIFMEKITNKIIVIFFFQLVFMIINFFLQQNDFFSNIFHSIKSLNNRRKTIRKGYDLNS